MASLAHDLGGVLVDQVVAALDGVEGVPLPVVLLDVGQGGAHAALRRAGVGAGRVELGEHRGAGALAGLERRAHAGAAGADDDDVVLVGLHGAQILSGVMRLADVRQRRGCGSMHGSKVKITRVPSTRTTHGAE